MGIQVMPSRDLSFLRGNGREKKLTFAIANIFWAGISDKSFM